MRLTQVSIHAPAGGATSGQTAGTRCQAGFNPRSRGGSDIAEFRRLESSGVSIHAPAGGATPLF